MEKPVIREDQVKMYYDQEKKGETEFATLTYEEYCTVIEETFVILYGE